MPRPMTTPAKIWASPATIRLGTEIIGSWSSSPRDQAAEYVRADLAHPPELEATEIERLRRALTAIEDQCCLKMYASQKEIIRELAADALRPRAATP